MSGTTSGDGATLAYGLTAGGFVRMRLPEIRRSIFDTLNATTGDVFDETPNSFMGQIVNVFAEREAALWELLELVYLSRFPVTAFGQSLDLAVSFSGVRRLQDTPSRAPLILFGAQGTIVPQGSVVESTFLPEGLTRNPQFRLVSGAVITRDDLAHLELAIPATVTAGRQYLIRWNGQSVLTAANSGETATQIASLLATTLAGLGAEATASAAVITITGPSPFAASWSDTVSLVRTGSPAIAEATEGGAVAAPIGSLTRIITPVGGWDSVTNAFPATLGLGREDDSLLRGRYATGVFRLGAGVMPSIDANIRNDIPGILFAKTYENNTAVTDAEGRLPHSIELVADGGDSAAIGVRLFTLKGAGIQTNGNTLVNVMDVDGFKHPVRFTRPAPVYLYIRAQVVPDPEAAVPGDLDERVRNALYEFGTTLTVGEDVRLQHFAAHALRKDEAGNPVIPGIARLNLTLTSRTTLGPAPPTGEYTAADLSIGVRNRAAFDLTRVTVFR